MLKQRTYLGVGINYKSAINKDIFTHIEALDFLEIYTKKFFIKSNDFTLDNILKKIPIVLHGLDLSIGTYDEISLHYLQQLTEVINTIQFEWFSDHIAFTHDEVIEVGHLMPVAFNHRSKDNIVKKAKQIQQLSKKLFLLENITYYYPMPEQTMHEAEFMSAIINEADCGLLLDINNLYINAMNHQYDPYEFIHQLPLNRVCEIHLAGGAYKEGMLVDTHSHDIKKEVWELYDYACRYCPVSGVIIERDANINFKNLMQEVAIAREIMQKHHGKIIT